MTDANPLLANRLSRSPGPDSKRRTAGGPVTQNLSCWDYLIGVNHRLIVEFPQMFFQIMLAPGNMDSQSFGFIVKAAKEWAMMAHR